MEVQLQLDGNGRTTWVKPPDSNESEVPGSGVENSRAEIDFSSKTVMTSLVPPPLESKEEYDKWRTWMDDILFDCEISDCGLMPRTFWVSAAAATKPRCVLEQMALDVFHHHVPKDFQFDPSTSGAEWWVQIRPSPEGTGRYSMHDPQPDSMSKTGISFHWDKDEDLRLLAGGSLYVHPYLSTVTYLTDLGAPTMVVNCRVNNVTGDWIVPDDTVEGFVSWPKQGKHLSFDGRFLHAAPPDLMEDGAFEQQCTIVEKPSDEQHSKILKRRHRRVTFLVNIWLNYKPFNVEPFPDTMIDKLTKVDESKWKGVFTTSDENSNVKDLCVTVEDKTVRQDGSKTDCNDECSEAPVDFTWPMGDCDSNETIRMQMPLRSIRREAARGGNIGIDWKKSTELGSTGVCLSKPTQETSERSDKATGDGDTTTGDSGDASNTSEPMPKRTKTDPSDVSNT